MNFVLIHNKDLLLHRSYRGNSVHPQLLYLLSRQFRELASSGVLDQASTVIILTK